jgi:hypothetical protein
MIPGKNGSASLVAKALTDVGFITLRYDKRASGPQAMENVTRLVGKIGMQSYLEELIGGVRYLADRKDVVAGRIFVLSNSEGCIHDLNYQIHVTELPFECLVLTAAMAQPAGVLARSQLAAIPRGQPIVSGIRCGDKRF